MRDDLMRERDTRRRRKTLVDYEIRLEPGRHIPPNLRRLLDTMDRVEAILAGGALKPALLMNALRMRLLVHAEMRSIARRR